MISLLQDKCLMISMADNVSAKYNVFDSWRNRISTKSDVLLRFLWVQQHSNYVIDLTVEGVNWSLWSFDFC